MSRNGARLGLALVLTVVLALAGFVVARSSDHAGRTNLTAYFANTNGLFPGDEVRLMGVRVGKIERIEPQPQRVKVTFWVDDKYSLPADAKAVILSPSLVTARAIQLTPPYTGGPKLTNNAVIPQERTAVPVEYDDFREQMQRLTAALQPTEPDGVSTLGAIIDTAADNLRGQGPDIREAITKMSQAFSALGDHSDDLFTTVRNLALVVSALQDSTHVLSGLNRNLASISSLLANGDNEIGNALVAINDVADDVARFAADNREVVGTSADKLAAVTSNINDSIDDVEQILHIGPTLFGNFINIFQPAQQAISGAMVLSNFASPITFLCGALQAASRLGAEQAAKLCVQYLAPIFKNRQYNFPPIGGNPIVGAQARPNEITYSEDWLRPDYIPPVTPPAPAGQDSLPAEASESEPPHTLEVAAREPTPTDPGDGLLGLMVPPGGTP